MSARKSAKQTAAGTQPAIQGSKMIFVSDAYTRMYARSWHQQHATRIAASKKLLGLQFRRGDCHMHSNYSVDGTSTIGQIKEAADAAGLDFIFITDHDSTDQKHECKKFKRVWWGQEGGAGDHHLGILNIEKVFKPTGNFLNDFIAVSKRPGAMAFVPHPTGWFPDTRYTARQIKLLDKLPAPFHMEIVNGVHQFFDPWDITDAQSVKLWDRLLCQGKIVYAMGGSDAHMAHGLGLVWNGILSDKCNKLAILRTLRQGRYFVSDAPLINLTSGRAGMGQTINPRKGSTVTFRVATADVAGIYQLRVIKNGKVIKRVAGQERKLLRVTHSERFTGQPFYLRAEVTSLDSRRAFTNPIFVGS